MRKLINSGIQWIGKVPDSWKISNIGNEFKHRNTKVSDNDYQPLSVTKSSEGIVLQMENVAKSDAHDSRKMVLKNDFVINSRSDRKMSCGVSKYDGSVSLINIVIKSKGNIIPEYCHYLLKNANFAEEFYKWGHGIVADLWTTRWDDMRKISIPVPPKYEQIKISKFLDKKVNEIDLLIKMYEDSIENLKFYLKSKMWEYISNIFSLEYNNFKKCSNAKFIKIGALSNIVTKQTGFDYSNTIKPSLLDKDNGDCIPYLQTRHFKNNNFNFNTEYYVPNNIVKMFPKLLLNKNTLLFSIVGASIGNVAVFPANRLAFLGGAICKVELKNHKLYEYIKCIMMSEFGQLQIFKKINSSAQGTITVQNVRDFLIPIPDEDIMIEKITNYCSRLVDYIEQLVEIKNNKIEELNEFKKSIIYEYVTGKKEVI